MSVIFIPPASAASVPDATETTAGKVRLATSAEATAGVNDVAAMTPAKVKAAIDASISGGVTYRGTFDAGSPADLSNAVQGDLYIISGAGTYAGRSWAVGDHLLVNADMGGTLDGSKIDKIDSTDAVTSVAGRTGAVTLSASDISGLANVATSGAYADLSGKPTLGTAAALDVGTSALQVVQLDASAKLPAVDGSQLTNLPSAPVTSVAGRTGAVTLTASDISGLATVATTGAYSDLSGKPTLGTAAALDVGTSALQVVQLDASAKLPAVDGSQLTNLPSAPVTSVAGKTGAVTLTASDISGLATVATSGAYSDLSGLPTLGTAAALDVGTTALKVVQLDASAKLPAVDGSQLTNLPGGSLALDDLTDVTITTPSDNQVLKYQSGTWINASVSGTFPTIQNVSANTTLSALTANLLVRATGATVTVTLPAASSSTVGAFVIVKNIGTGIIYVARSGADTIDGATSIEISTQYESRTIYCVSSSAWEIF